MIDVVASNIRYYRKLKGLSIDKLAVLCQIESKIIGNYELSKVEMNITNITIIAGQLDVQAYELLIPRPPDKNK